MAASTRAEVRDDAFAPEMSSEHSRHVFCDGTANPLLEIRVERPRKALDLQFDYVPGRCSRTTRRLLRGVARPSRDVQLERRPRVARASLRLRVASTRGAGAPLGEPFIHHPLGVAKICAELRLDDESIAAALLHDVVEDTDVGADEVRAEFGEEIANLVEGVTKLTRIQFQSREHAEAENYRKMIVAMAHDLRVILIKLADRLHNMRTLEYLGREKQVQKARETLEVYAPLAHRLGIHKLKWELEGPLVRDAPPAQVRRDRGDGRGAPRRSRGACERGGDRLTQELDKVAIPAEISGRAKHSYSIYDKMAKKGREFNEIYDLMAMRVIVERSSDEGTRDCYGALGLIHCSGSRCPVASRTMSRCRSSTAIGRCTRP